MEFKELTVEDLTKGYIFSKDKREYSCIFCSEVFSEGRIYEKGSRLITAEQAVKEHVLEAHHGAFNGLVGLDRQINGLTDVQKKVLTGMYTGMSNKDLGADMGISSATVRTHRFNIQKMKREARILLAILENIENDSIRAERECLSLQIEENRKQEGGQEEHTVSRSFTVNNLHPFFTKFYLK